MRVLHIGKFFPPHAGGIERYSADLLGALAARGIGTAMLAHAAPGTHHTEHISIDGIDVTLAACHGQWIYAPISPGFGYLLARTIKHFKPDILHLHVPNTSAFWALLLPAARRLPWVLQWQSDVPLDAARPALRLAGKFYRPWENALLRRAAAVIASSAAYRDSSATLVPWLNKTHVIGLGLPALSTLPKNGKSILWPSDGLRLLAVGRLSYYKGFDVLLRALAEVSDVSLVLVGSGECDASLQALALQLGITERVHFAGHVDDATLLAIYASAQAFCLPSFERTEAFGMVLLEAMRAGLPVLACAIAGSGVAHVVDDEVTGLLVAPRDIDALARGLRRLIADAALRDRLGAAGHMRWQSEFSLDHSAQQTVALYESVQAEAAHRAAATRADSIPPD